MVSINFVDTGLDDRILKSIPVDNCPEELMKAVRDRTKLVPKVVVDKNGHRRTVLVRPDKGSKKDKLTSQPKSDSKKLSQMSESELKDRMKQVITRMSELSKEINSNSKSQGQLNSVATQAQKKEYDELVEENGNLMIELGKRKSTQDTKKDSPSSKSTQSTKKDKPTSQPKSDSKKLSYYKASDATKQKVMKATDGMSGDEVVKMCKDKGIEWEEHSHKGINNMRAKMALAKYFDDGGK